MPFVPKPLTPKQNAFALLIIDGIDPLDAFKQCYDTKSMNPTTIRANALQLAGHPGVCELTGGSAIVKVQPAELAISVDPVDLTKAWLLRQGMETYVEARKAGQPSAAKAALELLAKISGHLIERKDVRFIRTVDDLSDEELEAILKSGKMIEGVAIE